MSILEKHTASFLIYFEKYFSELAYKVVWDFFLVLIQQNLFSHPCCFLRSWFSQKLLSVTEQCGELGRPQLGQCIQTLCPKQGALQDQNSPSFHAGFLAACGKQLQKASRRQCGALCLQVERAHKTTSQVLCWPGCVFPMQIPPPSSFTRIISHPHATLPSSLPNNDCWKEKAYYQQAAATHSSMKEGSNVNHTAQLCPTHSQKSLHWVRFGKVFIIQLLRRHSIFCPMLIEDQ